MESQCVLDNKYIIKKEKGSGKTCKVYLVEDKETKKYYAAKILIHHCSFFDNEVEMLNELKSRNKDKKIPYIVNLINNGDAEIIQGKSLWKKQYILLEYAEKGDLCKYIETPQKGLKENHAKFIFYQILKGVKFIHDNEICHRDIKTQNILLDSNYHPKICDFGFATYISHNLKDCLGTKNYAAPEIWEGRPYNGKKVDIFSLGVLLFNLITGKYGFENSTKNNECYKFIICKKYDKFWEKNKPFENLPKEFKDLYIKMISYKPIERPSIEDILKDKWMEEIKNLEKDEIALKNLENEIREEFLEREDIINKSFKKTIIKEEKNENNNNNEVNRSLGDDEKNYFDYNINIRKYNPSKYVDNFIEIKGNLEPFKFMNILANKLKNKNEDYIIEENKSKLKFKVIIKEKEKDDEEINDEFTDDINKIIEEENKNIEKESNESEENEEEEDEKKDEYKIKNRDCIIKVELLKTENDSYILGFMKKLGEAEDYYNYIKILYSIIEKILI